MTRPGRRMEDTSPRRAAITAESSGAEKASPAEVSASIRRRPLINIHRMPNTSRPADNTPSQMPPLTRAAVIDREKLPGGIPKLR